MAQNFNYTNMNFALQKQIDKSNKAILEYSIVKFPNNSPLYPLTKWKFKNKKYSLSTVFINGNYETIIFDNKQKTIIEKIDNFEHEAKKTFNNLKSKFFKKRTPMFKIILLIRKMKYIKNKNKKVLDRFMR